MVTVPVAVGVALSGPSWAHLPLALAWWTGYFAFFALGLWLRSRRRPRYLPPVRVYVAATALAGLVLLAAAPYLLWWALPFAPLVAVTLWASANRRDRSLLNDVVTVGAAGLMTAVAYDAGTAGSGSPWGTGWAAGSSTSPSLPGASPDGAVTGWPWAWLVTALVTAYFLGTILYVKTNIRERGNRRYLLGSAGYHLGGAAVTGALAASGTVPLAHVAVWVVLALRAVAVPTVAARRGRPVRPMSLGLGEIALSLLVAVTLLLPG
jgi:hypothetical protein